MFERLHIDFAKHGWRASNQRGEFPQMIRWLSRQEKVTGFEVHQQQSQANVDSDQMILLHPPTKEKPTISIAKHPNFPMHSLSLIEERNCAPDFTHYLKVFLNSFNTKKVPKRHLDAAILSFRQVNVYNMFRFHPQGIHDEEEESDIVRALLRSEQNPHGRFDTIVAFTKTTGETTGLDGKRRLYLTGWLTKPITGTRVGRVRVIFTLPAEVNSITGKRPAPRKWPTEPLVYIEWYSTLQKTANPRHGLMYHIKKVTAPVTSSTSSSTRPRVQGAIIPLSEIRQSCMLFPIFPASVPNHWTPDNVLDEASSFYINNWLSKYSYQTIW